MSIYHGRLLPTCAYSIHNLNVPVRHLVNIRTKKNTNSSSCSIEFWSGFSMCSFIPCYSTTLYPPPHRHSSCSCDVFVYIEPVTPNLKQLGLIEPATWIGGRHLGCWTRSMAQSPREKKEIRTKFHPYNKTLFMLRKMWKRIFFENYFMLYSNK